MGFGCAQSSGGYGTYVVEMAHDKSGSGCDYDFIAWPSSGNFPTSLFDGSMAWSITVNPQKYAAPSASSVTVTLKRDSDGKTWSFGGGQSSGGYFNVDTAGYGVANCIVFRPSGMSDYAGTYTVTVSGLRSSAPPAAPAP